LAISGLHVGLVAMLVLGFCWLLPIATRRGHILRSVVAILTMLLYAFATGLSPSVVRATLMFCTAQMALAYGSAKSSLNLLTAAATVMLIVNPNNLFDISFQLSFLAVVGITLGFGPLMELTGATHSRRPIRALWGVVIVGLTSTIATLPLVGHTFSTVSLVGIFLNPLVIVTAEIIVLLGFIWVTLPLGFLQPVASTLIQGAAELQNRLVEGAGSLSWAALEVEIPAWVVVLSYLLMATGIIVSLLWKEKKVWKIGR
jgi:competence protein ComEC